MAFKSHQKNPLVICIEFLMSPSGFELCYLISYLDDDYPVDKTAYAGKVRFEAWQL